MRNSISMESAYMKIKGNMGALNREDLLLYAITDRAWLDIDSEGNKREESMTLKDQVEIAIDSGVTMLQLREKHIEREEFINEAKEINYICKDRGIPLIINDDPGIAIEVGASGVHLGQGDMDRDKARSFMPRDMILGVSAATVEEAKTAEECGADYIGVGDIFGTSSKDNTRHVSKEDLIQICKSVHIPVVAIGGITYNNIHELANTGVSGIAVISAVFSKMDIAKAVKELKLKALKTLY